MPFQTVSLFMPFRLCRYLCHFRLCRYLCHFRLCRYLCHSDCVVIYAIQTVSLFMPFRLYRYLCRSDCIVIYIIQTVSLFMAFRMCRCADSCSCLGGQGCHNWSKYDTGLRLFRLHPLTILTIRCSKIICFRRRMKSKYVMENLTKFYKRLSFVWAKT